MRNDCYKSHRTCCKSALIIRNIQNGPMSDLETYLEYVGIGLGVGLVILFLIWIGYLFLKWSGIKAEVKIFDGVGYAFQYNYPAEFKKAIEFVLGE